MVKERPALNRHWQKFFARFDEIDELPASEWTAVHVLAHICKRFKEVFGREFSITVKSGAPSKSIDLFMAKQIIATLDTSNMRTVKDYVDWVYSNKIIPNKTKFRRIGFFTTAGFANEFYFARTEGVIIKRSTVLPNDYKRLADQLGVPANTYGDLAFIKMAAEQVTDKNNPYCLLFANLEAMGFDSKILQELSE